MLLNCPHCYLLVGVNADGICPNCQKDVNDLSEIDQTKSPLILSGDPVMPKRCCLCGESTKRKVKVSKVIAHDYNEGRSTADDDVWLWNLVSLLFGSIIAIFSLLFFWSTKSPSRSTMKVEYQLPQCEKCSSTSIDPIEVDLAKFTMKISADNRFIEVYKELNSKAWANLILSLQERIPSTKIRSLLLRTKRFNMFWIGCDKWSIEQINTIRNRREDCV